MSNDVHVVNGGKGPRFAQRVDEQGRAFGIVDSLDSEEWAARRGDSFILHGECHLAAATAGALMYYENDSDDYLVAIGRVYVDAHSLSDDIIIRQAYDPTRANGTAITATGIVQKHRRKPTTGLPGTLHISDGSSDMTFSANGTRYHGFTISSLESIERDMHGTNILGKGDGIGWDWATVDGANGVDAEIISLSVNCYRFKADEI